MVVGIFTISPGKFFDVVQAVLSERPYTTEYDIAEFIFIGADWPEGDEHQNWLDTADTNEIADWVITGMERQEWETDDA